MYYLNLFMNSLWLISIRAKKFALEVDTYYNTLTKTWFFIANIKLFQSNWNNNFISVKYGVQLTFSLLVSTSWECLDQRQQELYFKELRHLDNHQEAKRWALAISSNYYTRSVKAAILFLSIFIISILLK